MSSLRKLTLKYDKKLDLWRLTDSSTKKGLRVFDNKVFAYFAIWGKIEVRQ